MPETTLTVGRLAEQVRAKNAGPFWITFDVFLSSDADYQTLVDSETISAERIAQTYRVAVDTIEIFHLPNIRVVKVSFPRSVTAGSFEDRDQHAGQQHIPLSLLPLITHSQDARSVGDQDQRQQ